VTEFVKGGNLSQAIFGTAKFDPKEIAISIARGMVYLHNQQVIHRYEHFFMYVDSLQRFKAR
jgi:hypothetical protein